MNFINFAISRNSENSTISFNILHNISYRQSAYYVQEVSLAVN